MVRLDQAIQSEVAIELLGVEDAPGVKEGGVMEHITHEITVETLPTDIPESIAVDVSGMVIGDTLQLDSVIAPEGVTFALGEASRPRRSRSRPSTRRGSRSPSPRSRKRPSLWARTASRSRRGRGRGRRGEAEAGDGGGDSTPIE